jgi:hypothetical protein
MIAALMLMFSFSALAKFFMSYCRSLPATYAQRELSTTTREIIGIQSAEVTGAQFRRVLGLARTAPSPGDDNWDLRVIPFYNRVVRLAGLVSSPLSSVARGWVEKQSSLCAYFAAAALDRRLAAVAAR